MITSLTSHSFPDAPYDIPLKQCRFLGLGITAMLVLYFTPLAPLRRAGWLIWAVSLALTFATLLPGVGVKVGGARRWLDLGFIRFQPMEMLTMAAPFFLADRLAKSQRDDAGCFWRPTMLVACLSALPMFFQPNMGGIILVFAICMSTHAAARGWKYPLLASCGLALFFWAMIYMEGYRMRRLFAFLDPWKDPTDTGFQIIQGLVAFSNGGLTGVGIGKGLQKLNYLPAAHTDYIFPVIGEEFGLIGTMAVLALYAAWTLAAWSLYRRADSVYHAVLIWGLAASVLFPMFVNLGGVMKLIPLTGVPLPFMSAGGTAMVFMWVRVGLLMRVSAEIAEARQR
jgi:cell division protein FtsW